MPRKQYPSDHRRWFRVTEDILDDPKLSDATPPEVFRFYIRLLAMLNRTKSKDGEITLSEGALGALCGRRHPAAISRILRIAEGVGLISHMGVGGKLVASSRQVRGKLVRISVCKWPKRQEIAPTTKTTPTPSTLRDTKKPVSLKHHTTRKPRAPGWALRAALALTQRVVARHPGARVPKSQTHWARMIVMIEATPEEITAVIEWLYGEANDGRYRIEVQSGKALRDKFGQCQAAIERQAASGKGSLHTAVQNVMKELTDERPQLEAGKDRKDKGSRRTLLSVSPEARRGPGGTDPIPP